MPVRASGPGARAIQSHDPWTAGDWYEARRSSLEAWAPKQPQVPCRHPLTTPWGNRLRRPPRCFGTITMATLFFEEALLESGWASEVRLEVSNGLIASVQAGTRPVAGDERYAIGLPGMPNLHSHAFQRAMAGL